MQEVLVCKCLQVMRFSLSPGGIASGMYSPSANEILYKQFHNKQTTTAVDYQRIQHELAS